MSNSNRFLTFSLLAIICMFRHIFSDLMYVASRSFRIVVDLNFALLKYTNIYIYIVKSGEIQIHRNSPKILGEFRP